MPKIKRKKILTDEEFAAQQSTPKAPSNKPTASLAGPIQFRPEEKKREVGRPNGYSPEYATIARKLCELGATDSDLADAFDVSTGTIKNWRSQFPEFFTAICEAKKDVFDPLIERSLAQRALGYEVDTIEKKVLGDGSLVSYPVRKHIPPDTQAIRYWLNNRKPREYRERQEVTGPNNGPVQVLSLDPARLAGLTPKELDVLDKVFARLSGEGQTIDATVEGDGGDSYTRLIEGGES
jgi:hypothetical protein